MVENTNFANWELTQLLPIINPYNSTKAIDSMGYEQLVSVCQSMLKPEEWRYLWTWEDIRLYLNSKGFIIEYTAFSKDYTIMNRKEDRLLNIPVLRYSVKIYQYRDVKEGKFSPLQTIKFYSPHEDLVLTYEEARVEAIKYCLSLLVEL